MFGDRARGGGGEVGGVVGGEVVEKDLFEWKECACNALQCVLAFVEELGVCRKDAWRDVWRDKQRGGMEEGRGRYLERQKLSMALDS